LTLLFFAQASVCGSAASFLVPSKQGGDARTVAAILEFYFPGGVPPNRPMRTKKTIVFILKKKNDTLPVFVAVPSGEHRVGAAATKRPLWWGAAMASAHL
jgi:hypothetical protein